MMKKILPFILVVMIFSGLSLILINSSKISEKPQKHDGIEKGAPSFSGTKAFLASVRNNQETGILDPADAINAQKEVKQLKESNAGKIDFEWSHMGPNNVAGRTRSVLFDNQDATGKTLYAGAVTGGVFKSVNLGASWENVSLGFGTTLNVSCMNQADDGTIYIGTGEGFDAPGYSILSDYGFETGFVGKGLFTLSGGNTFALVGGTLPDSETSNFAYINEIEIASNGDVWVATNTGLWLYKNATWTLASSADGDMNNLCWDVKVSDIGFVITIVNGVVYKSTSGSVNGFTSLSTGEDNMFPTIGIGRCEFAIAPLDQNVVYACAASDGSDFSGPDEFALYNLYRSNDGGNSWEIVLPGGSSTYYILGANFPSVYYQGDYNNAITVFPNDPGKILIGGVDLWIGNEYEGAEYFQMNQATFYGFNNPIFDFYVHADHHKYVFRPGHPNEFVIATDGGLFLGDLSGSDNTFASINKFIPTTQYYKLAVSTELEEVLGGTQDNGTLILTRNNFNNLFAMDVWQYPTTGLPEGSDGGFCEMSNIWWYKEGIDSKPPAIFMSRSPNPAGGAIGDRIRRSESMGFDYSLNFVNGDVPNGESMTQSNDHFYIPMKLWENYNDNLSTDVVKFLADRDYIAGETIMARSENYDHPFDHVLSDDLAQGDSIFVQDIITTKFFVATEDRVWMTFDALKFAESSTWFDISDSDHSGFTGVPQSISYTADANTVFVGTVEGKLFRISNIKYGHYYDELDVFSPDCIIATDELDIDGEISQVITSISVDPEDGNKVLVTLGNYGNDNYVYFSNNALSDYPEFNSVQGNLPKMPVFASLLEMNAGDLALIGTEQGVFASDDVSSGDWYFASETFGDVPVFDIIQQSNRKERYEVSFVDPGTGDEFKEVFPELKNYGEIYIATYGNGVYRSGLFHQPVGVNDHEISSFDQSLNIYPNPTNDIANISFELENSSNAIINVYDLSGRVVYTNSYNRLSIGENKINFDVQQFPQGTYLVQLSLGQSVRSAKLIVK